ncbi:uncharacterized protein BJX67DRAFT_365862 [Aspergillus lucknowensis]|uniref:D-xylose 1-dehydrogenase (NADP(+), D-xylono-1,5-lactone-forming) n=1 Tax=Aspergillus lucknowensis TaxID=176173 RepID=A0ABR4LDJ3_9EURO
MDFVEGTGATTHNSMVYTKYEDLYTDSGVDIVNVGLLHMLHRNPCLGAIAVRKCVLYEKPTGVNTRKVDDIIALAKEKRVFVMEGNCPGYSYPSAYYYLG